MYEKNKVMNMLCLVTVALSFIVFALHTFTTIIPVPMNMDMDHMSHGSMDHVQPMRYVLLAIPLILFLVSLSLFAKQPMHAYLPVLNTLILTFGSIALIAAGDGLVEYHFSVFMVVAFVAFYDSLKLVLLTTVIFAVHHIAGFFLFPELICGHMNYSFSLLLIHAVFLLLTSAAASLLIVTKHRTTRSLEAQKHSADELNRTALNNLQHTGQYMEQSASSLQTSSQSLVLLSEEIARSVEQISSAATSQLLPSQQQSEDKLNRMTAAIHDIASALEQLRQSSATTIDRAQHGRQSLDQITERISSLQSDVEQMAAGIHGVDDRAQEIARFIGIIAHLAEETNLLSLNASIEAARAGEHGKSFAVVAQQVKKLSIETADALQRMSAIINEFTGATGNALQSSERGAQQMRLTLDDVRQTHETFRHIVEATKLNGQQVEQITTRTLELDRNAEAVNEATHYVTEMIQQSLNSQQMVAGTVNQQLEHSYAVRNEADQLNKMGDQLSDLMQQFSQQHDTHSRSSTHSLQNVDSDSHNRLHAHRASTTAVADIA
ncbi:methyl-accepting chemotaxis protein [Paenibacillus sp. WLX1005]|uniref:methyl-accepting chemotaxis protein n=1 Tax=Paenibacillus sp. WLX1005 TaxID=3243766 RepID=UPI0039841C33